MDIFTTETKPSEIKTHVLLLFSHFWRGCPPHTCIEATSITAARADVLVLDEKIR